MILRWLPFALSLSKGVFLFVFCKKLNRTEFEMARNTNPRGVNHDR